MLIQVLLLTAPNGNVNRWLFFNGPAAIGNTVTNLFTIKLNGHERFRPREMRYFRRVQVNQHTQEFHGHC